jgi:hypothetical protein
VLKKVDGRQAAAATPLDLKGLEHFRPQLKSQKISSDEQEALKIM